MCLSVINQRNKSKTQFITVINAQITVEGPPREYLKIDWRGTVISFMSDEPIIELMMGEGAGEHNSKID